MFDRARGKPHVGSHAELPFGRRRGPGRWRWIVLALVVVNLLYFAWSQGWLALFGWLPERFGQTEPHRVQQQIRPGALQVVPPGAPTPAR